jgi:hypothetical protein
LTVTSPGAAAITAGMEFTRVAAVA